MTDHDDIIGDIIKPRVTLAKSKATEIWSGMINKKIPVMLNDIVKALDIPVREANLEIDGVSRMDCAGLTFILYKRDTSDVRKRFTVAHEIGHIILEHINFSNQSSQFSNKSQEIEANVFAGALLVPKSDLKIFLKNKDKTLDDTINRYWVSKDVAIIALKDNHLLNNVRV